MTDTIFRTGYIYGLYCLCHKSRIRYVGQTIYSPEKRLGDHLSTVKARLKDGASLSHSQRWMLKHGLENIACCILEVCFVSEMDSREEAWIAEMDGLTNIRPGGGQARGWKMPPESVAKRTGAGNPMYGKDRSELMSRIRKMVGPMSEAERQRRRDALAERRLDPEAERLRVDGIRRSHSKPGYKQSARERVLAEKNPMYGKTWTEEQRTQILEKSMARAGVTAEMILKMRSMYASGMKNREIAEVYGKTENYVSNITSGRRWGHVA